MNFNKFRLQLWPLLVFNRRDIEKIEEDFNDVNLTNWSKAGYIYKIIKGFYTMGDTSVSKSLLYFASNKIIDPSYVSCESALRYYNILTMEDSVVSVNPKKTYLFKSEYGNFLFHKTRTDLMKDYEFIRFNNHCFKIATPEKALADFFFFNPEYQTRDKIRDLQFNAEELNAKINKDNLISLSYGYKNEQLERRIRNFINLFMRL